MGEPAAFWPRGGAWSTGPPHFHPLDATGSTAQASRRRFGPILEPGQQGLLTFLFRVPSSPRCHRFEEARFFRVSFHSFRQKRVSPSEWTSPAHCPPRRNSHLRPTTMITDVRFICFMFSFYLHFICIFVQMSFSRNMLLGGFFPLRG